MSVFKRFFNFGRNNNQDDPAKKTWSEQEIDTFVLENAINENPLAKRPVNIRSKLAYKTLLENAQPTKKYLLPGQFAVFNYLEPKHKEELEYYDSTPFVLVLGITRTKEGQIREICVNLHYYPPFARARILNRIYEVFKPWWKENFNEVEHEPQMLINYEALKHILRTNLKLKFGIKMYVPSLRGNTHVIPAKLLPYAFHTEGHFSKATMQQIFKFWRQFR